MSRDPDLTDPDNPEWTEADFARARPPEEVLPPEVLAQFPRTPRRRGPQRAPTKVSVNLRLSRDVVERLKVGGRGWTQRLDDLLRRTLGL